MYFKPYKDIVTAIRNWRNDYYLRTGEVKIKLHNNINKDERSLIDAAILCKVLKTFETNYDALKRQYNIRHMGHFFWDNTTWQMKYKDATCTFEIHSSDFGDQPDYIQWIFTGDCTSGVIGTCANFSTISLIKYLKISPNMHLKIGTILFGTTFWQFVKVNNLFIHLSYFGW